jgi:predicted HTH domain antitoxin
MMATVMLELTPEVLASLRLDADAFVKEMRVAAAVKWYELGKLSQSKASQVAELSRVEFLEALHRYGVTPYQYDAEEILREVRRV